MVSRASEKAYKATERHKRCLLAFAWVNQDQRPNMAGKDWRSQGRLHLTVISDDNSVTLYNLVRQTNKLYAIAVPPLLKNVIINK